MNATGAVKIVAGIGLAFTINEDENEVLQKTDSILTILLKSLEEATNASDHNTYVDGTVGKLFFV